MKRFFLSLAVLLPVLSTARVQPDVAADSIAQTQKEGWNIGVLPSIAYDADCGFQGGLLANLYDYGSGEQYPEYIHSLYFEAAYTTKHTGIFRFNYDSKYVIPNHRLTIDLAYLRDALCDFYGFNGYQAVYQPLSHHSAYMKNAAGDKVYDPQKMDIAAYRTRAFYKFKRDLVRAAIDWEGPIHRHWHWNVGIGLLGYMCDTVHTAVLNRGKEGDRRLPPQEGLYEKYRKWGILSAEEVRGGWHPYIRVGGSFDSRDQRQGPNSGIYADVFLTYSAAFNAGFGQQADAGYNHLRLNATFRHYVQLYPKWVVLAYRIGVQNTIVGKSPFYQNTYLNTLFMQRVIYEGLGGGNSIRGVLRNRVLANGVGFANIELRCKIVPFDIGRQHFYIGLNPFVDMGMVLQPYDMDALVRQHTDGRYQTVAEAIRASGEEPDDFFRLDANRQSLSPKSKDVFRPHLSAGIGLKIVMNENFCVSVDWAKALHTQDGASWTNFYVKMGYLF